MVYILKLIILARIAATLKLKEDLVQLVERLRHTGVGALPLITDASPAPTEAELMTHCLNSLKALYDKLQKSNESAAVVANLVSPEYIAKSSSLPTMGPVAMSTPSASFSK
ncbi:hypothetical protein BJ165DRAFT_1500292 [Panaeolus papilionaceus]|nr:hypothetical protein BJ165DRAFT_1500292 [Panaeolus papilionaceus]